MARSTTATKSPASKTRAPAGKTGPARDHSIQTYRSKRDFTQTKEPAPADAQRASDAPIFVVQKHDASRLHYDFRLEHGGVLWSWAVPKGPSLDPHDKRLAVHVEDHPVDYAQFEGTIPAGNYGAGDVEIWDRGTWAPVGDADAGLAAGELKFTLDGERLHGRFVLIRLKPRPKEHAENWLLIKEHDDQEAAGVNAAAMEERLPKLPAQKSGSAPKKPAGKPAAKTAPKAAKAAPAHSAWKPPAGAKQGALPQSQAPMLAGNADAPPEGAEWLSEIKYDGYRLLVFKDGDAIRLLTRNGLDWTHRFPTVAREVAALPADTLLADGELVALQKDGLSSFPDLQAALSDGRDTGLNLYLFDLLYRDGYDLRALPLTERKEALEALGLGDGMIRFSEHLEGETARVRTQGCAMGLEGIIAKRASSPYRAGRSSAWLKLKCQGREEFVVLGWTPPGGSRAGLGSLHLGFYDDKGNLHYVGGCGSGFSDKVLASLSKTLATLASDPPAGLLLTEEKPPAGLHWVRPELVAEVQYTGWSGAGRLRHPVFLGLREDKAPRDVVRDIPNPEVKRSELGAGKTSHSGRVVTARKPGAKAASIGDVRLTHPERELWPGGGLTKQRLAEYWRDVAEVALPGIAHRPLAFVRCPDGIEGEHFFQKHANRGMPAQIHEGEQDGAPYLALEDADGLVACAQMSAIELHSWGSTEADAAHPDRLIFDLDPGDGVAWPDIVRAAHDLKDVLERDNLASFCRTSGGKGLHLVVPLTPSVGWDAARAWSRAFAERLEREKPSLYVASVPKARRTGRILIDWLRNGLGSTAVASFSPRARPGATVATPLAWREVTDELDPSKFTILTTMARLKKLSKDPWDGYDATRQKLNTKLSTKPEPPDIKQAPARKKR